KYVMSKLFKRTAISVLCAIMLACAVAVGTIFGLNSRANKINGIAGGNGGHSAVAGSVTITPDNFDKEYDMDGTDCAAQSAIWNEAINYSKTNGKTVRLNLMANWVALGNSNGTSFGTGDGFTTSITGNSMVAGSGYAGSILVPTGAKVILNLNGYTIDRGSPNFLANSIGGVIYVQGTLEVRDDSFLYDSNGYDKGVIKGGQASYGGAIGLASGASLTVSGGTFTLNASAEAGGALCGFQTTSTITVNGGCFIDNGSVNYGGAIFSNGTVTINGGTFRDNYQSATTSVVAMASGGPGLYGGGVLAISPTSTLTINDGLFESNYSNCFGGVIIAYGNGTDCATVNIYGGTFNNNTALSTSCGNGGVLYCDGTVTVNIAGGVFSNNRVYYYGGVICTYGVLNNITTTLNISGGEFYNNQANAGSVIMMLAGYLNMSGGYMHDNVANVTPLGTASYYTGTIFMSGSNAHVGNPLGVSNAEFSGGKVVNNNGGGVYTFLKNTIKLCGGLIVEGNSDYNLFLPKQNLNSSNIVSGDVLLTITGELVKDGQAAHIGISFGPSGAIANQLSAGQTAYVTQGYGSVYPNTSYPNATFTAQPYQGSFFFSDGAAYSGMNNKECVFGVLTASQTTIKKIELTWTYKLNGVTTTSNSNYLRCEYGDEITEVTATWSGTRPTS
ncbi:MAG: hypothetical protein K2G96_04695, partial [Clostridia bacterium]|nr:hypothetical protein [Clostridia bacterium]